MADYPDDDVPLIDDRGRTVTRTVRDEPDVFLSGLPGRPAHRPILAREPVSASAIHAWCDAMGERGPAFTGPDPVAPPATLQMWTMPGLAPDRPVDAGPAAPGDLDLEVRTHLAELGFTATLATATDQVFTGDLRPGDLVTARDTYTSVSRIVETALGPGRFLDSRASYTTQHGVEVGRMTLTVFVYRPHPRATPAVTPATVGSATPDAARSGPLTAGMVLPDVRIPVTPTLVIAGALATRDVYPVHHDRDFARASGHPDILMNILTTNGLLARVAGEWCGGARLTRLVTRLRSPAYPQRTLTVGGTVTEAADGRVELAVRAATEDGVHAEATVHLEVGGVGT